MKMNQDCLSRQPYLDLLKSIVEKQKENPSGYAFAIDGDWGSGKTWMLNTLKNMLLSEKDNEYLIFHYNAWENDFYEEPLVALLSVMIEKLNEVTSQNHFMKRPWMNYCNKFLQICLHLFLVL